MIAGEHVAPGTRRLTRSVRYLSPAEALQALDQFAYLERACSHILAGWIVKTPELEVKIAWGRQLSANMDHASRLRDRGRALRAGGDAEVCVPEAWRDHLRAGDESTETLSVLRCLHGVKHSLISRYSDYLKRADPVGDALSVEIVESARRAAETQAKWMKRQVGTRAVGARVPAPLSPRRVPRGRGPEVTTDAALWPPLDRVPRVVRPQGMRRGEPGALRLLPIHPRSRKDTGLFLHNFLNEEFATLELVARNSYEHPEMPWAFHRDAARHAADEARHAEMFMRALPAYGVRYGDYPIYTYSYEGEYEFPGTGATPGSSRELLWRILLRQVVHEGLALDSTPFEIRKREYLKQPELARLFSYILADEVFHAGSGVKWSHYLVSGDEGEFQRERNAAYSHYAARLKDRRLTWGASHIREAAEEERQLAELAQHHRFPFKMEVNIAARKRAGFSEEDIRRAAEDRKR
jgi:uncharacterized ferritin-like protein (DUF455 family)